MLQHVLRPWRSARTLREACAIATDLLVGTVTFTVVVTLLSVAGGLLIVLPLAVPVVWALFVSARAMGTVERSRLAALLDLEIADPHPPLTGSNWLRRLLERIGAATRWKEIAYLLLRLPAGVVTFTVTLAAASAGLALLFLPFYVSALGEGSANFGLFRVGFGVGALAVAGLGLVLVLATPWLVRVMAGFDRWLARRLLSRRPSVGELSAELTRVEARRAAAVDAGEAERRRIERDLHDGAQQRLVSLAMDLGQAREKMPTDPEGAARLVADAHEEAKRALTELRELVRGIHPAILEDRGLDAALSAVVARCPVPVTLDITLAARPPAAVESTAYFVVAEALTNVARHSRATRATVTIAGTADRVVVEVTDDGAGGADPARGTGLAGLAERVAGVGGWVKVLSPPGGPTTLLAEIPCAS